MTDWRDPSSEDYKIPSRSEVMPTETSSNLGFSSRLKKYVVVLTFLSGAVAILFFFGGWLTTLSRQNGLEPTIDSGRAHLSLNLDNRYSVVAVAKSVKALEKSNGVGRILEELLLITETIEDPEEQTHSLLSISEAYIDLENIESAKRVFILAIESFGKIEEGASRSVLLSRILELYAILYMGEANGLLEIIKDEINQN